LQFANDIIYIANMAKSRPGIKNITSYITLDYQMCYRWRNITLYL